ncbi:hypothetical protein EC973_005653 [Apophysomyces ossiformis]|uniref:Choline/carnitine acyltransferase domain-containing protein n=1 Tax=Apophysomyces ossiformis TaxID=679940 RepID=A0A8H7BK55_9FUNG|nr:hypothetical protein EC973_005653 [Apophysomyces ossiformis]
MSAPTFSLQHTLPRLPVPSLKESCALYLRSIQPLQTEAEHAKTRQIVEDFVSSELGKSLQQRLVDIDRSSPYNWLEDNFWLRKAYLEWREPLMVNSNWYILGQDDEKHPQILLTNDTPIKSGEFSYFQVRRAAHMIYHGLEYKESIDKQTLPVDMMRGGKAQCMWQYSRYIGVTRVPLHHCDTLVQEDPATLHHIIVLVRDQIYKLMVYRPEGDQWVRLTTDEIESGLLAIVRHAQQLRNPQPAVPLLTSWDRDNWALARNHLLTLDPSNRDALNIIETGLFAVALDDHNSGNELASRTRTMFCGHQSLGNGHNRWYDKSYTLIVENNGKCGVSGEHSPVDALTVSYLFDHMLKAPCTGQLSTAAVAADRSVTEEVHHLKWTVDDQMVKFISEAQVSADATAANSDSDVLYFDDFGTSWIKKVGKVPPDAFFQMVLQLTYYRLHKKVTATYETASTRKYLRGRTETIRTCSIESKQFVEGWSNPDLDAKAKYELLVKATAAHRKYTQIASDGHGCDRHLMTLRLLNADHQIRSPVTGKIETVPIHPIFKDPIYTESQTWRLSTSGLHEGIRLMGTGFGAVYRDGYGINYMPAPTVVKFGIESKRVPETVSTKTFVETLRQTLRDMRAVCEEVNNPNQKESKL